jgi:hypothetical protein
MPLKQSIEDAKQSTFQVIDNSNLDESTKILYRKTITDSAEGTNGLDERGKLQNVSESCFALSELFIKTDIANHRRFDEVNEKLDVLGDKIDILTAKMEAQPQKRSRLEIIMGSLQNIQWWWAAALVAVVGILAYGDHIMDVLNRIM